MGESVYKSLMYPEAGSIVRRLLVCSVIVFIVSQLGPKILNPNVTSQDHTTAFTPLAIRDSTGTGSLQLTK